MKDQQREGENIRKTYYRSYGTHPIEPLDPKDPPDYIVSHPSWEKTREALRGFPRYGNVITTEYSTTPGDFLEWTASPDLIYRNIAEAMKMTEGSEATLYLGTPFHIWSNSQQRSRWLNAVLAIRNGELISTTFKQDPMPAESRFLGIEKPKVDPRVVLGGNAVLICNELFLHTKKDPDNFILKGQDVRKVFSPSLWAIPRGVPEDLDPHKVKDGNDEYYRQKLETKVAEGVFAVMQTVRRVIVADLGRKGFPNPPFRDMRPFNAVFDRI